MFSFKRAATCYTIPNQSWGHQRGSSYQCAYGLIRANRFWHTGLSPAFPLFSE